MNAKRRFAGAVLLVVLAGTLGRAQAPANLPFLVTASAQKEVPTASTVVETAPPGAVTGVPVQPYAPDSWIYQQGNDCFGPLGAHGPISTEIYLRSGPSFPIAGADFGKALRTGWEVMGGGRSLFFTPDGMRAWVVDLGLSYTYNDGHPTKQFAFNNTTNVTLRNLHRTAVSLGFGHDWFMFGSGPNGGGTGSNWSYGFDGGARWGTGHVDLTPTINVDGYLRRHDVYGATYAAIHANWEKSMGGWTLLAGVRGEWSYSFMDMLPNQSTGLHDINVLFTLGARW